MLLAFVSSRSLDRTIYSCIVSASGRRNVVSEASEGQLQGLQR